MSHKASACARQVLERHWDGRLQVSPEAVAAKLGLRVSTGGSVARLDRSQGLIEVGSALSSERRRFALAHAIGHFVLGHDTSEEEQLGNFSSSTSMCKAEVQANAFALSLLAPEEAVRRLVLSGQFKSALCLSKAFGISLVAMVTRINGLKMVV